MYQFDQNGKIVLVKQKRHLADKIFKKTNNKDADENEIFKDFFEENDEEIFYNMETNSMINKIFRRKNDILEVKPQPQQPDNSKLSLTTSTSKLSLKQEETLQRDGRLTMKETQTKYALLAKMAYFEGDEEKVMDFTSKNSLINGFELDKELSGQKNQVFVNGLTGEVVLSFKGTNPKNVEDLWDDYTIFNPLLNEKTTDRFKRAEELYNKVIEKYGKDSNIKSVGHSLGAEIAMSVGEEHDIETHAYNIGMSVNEAVNTESKNNKNKVFIYRTSGDPVSVATYANLNQNRKVITVEQKFLFDSHSIDNFTIDEKSKSRQVVDDVNDDINNVIKESMKAVEKAIVKTAYDEFVPTEIQKADKFINSKMNDKFVDVLKSDTRKQEDKLMELADSQKKSTNIETDMNGNIVVKDGIRFVQVMGDKN